ncbi:MAG: protein translocase subunit SecF [Oscillospiraceae bacterium]|nr:protein translocase subunit SecF [Oscillospiraceae bacterium]
MSKNNKSNNSYTANVKVRDFYGTRKVFFIISIVLVAVSILSSFIFGVGISIEFKGGTIADYSYTGTVNENDLASAAKDVLGTNVRVQLGETFTGDTSASFTVSFSMDEPFTVELQDELMKTFTEKYPDSEIELLQCNDVAASAGKNFFGKCIVAASFAAIVLILYIAWRFKKISGWSAGLFAVVTLLHDLTTVYGAFVICGFEIDSNFMAVILTILGYSVNDTIVIYDRIRENQQLMPQNTPLVELVNTSLSQTMRRTIRTSITTITTMLIVTILAAIKGVDSILSFSIPLMIGMMVGCYSSLCFAPMLWTSWKTRKAEAKD